MHISMYLLDFINAYIVAKSRKREKFCLVSFVFLGREMSKYLLSMPVIIFRHIGTNKCKLHVA